MPTLREFDAACTMVEAISCAHTGLAARMLEAGVDPNIPSDVSAASVCTSLTSHKPSLAVLQIGAIFGNLTGEE